MHYVFNKLGVHGYGMQLHRIKYTLNKSRLSNYSSMIGQLSQKQQHHNLFLMGVAYLLQVSGFRKRQTRQASSGQATRSSSNQDRNTYPLYIHLIAAASFNNTV